VNALLPLQLGKVWLALPAEHVQEILGGRGFVPIPGAPSHLPGVLPWRGRAVAVLDLAALIGVGETLLVRGHRDRNVVVSLASNTVAIPVDIVHEVREVDDDKVRPAHATSQRYSSTEVDIQGFLMPVLDVPAIFAAMNAQPAEASA
jgi:chemotaxis signal transduction protein